MSTQTKNKVIADARKTANRLLSRKEHSRQGLSQALLQRGYPASLVEILIAELEHTGLLSESRFVDSFIASKRFRYGHKKILFELKKTGVTLPEMERARIVLLKDEREVAEQIWMKRFGEHTDDAKVNSKRIRFMMGRGFSREIVEKIAFKNRFY